jgi:hypothetical protein
MEPLCEARSTRVPDPPVDEMDDSELRLEAETSLAACPIANSFDMAAVLTQYFAFLSFGNVVSLGSTELIFRMLQFNPNVFRILSSVSMALL